MTEGYLACAMQSLFAGLMWTVHVISMTSSPLGQPAFPAERHCALQGDERAALGLHDVAIWTIANAVPALLHSCWPRNALQN